MTDSGPKAIVRYNRAMTSQKIAIVAFDGITPFHLSVPCLVFGAHLGGRETPLFELLVCSSERPPLRTAAGFDIATSHGLGVLDEAAIVVVPSWHSDGRAAPAPLLAALQRAHQRGARVVGLCLGAIPLAQAGLLDGRAATTHWEYAPVLAKCYPKVKVDREVLYVDDGGILTSAGVAAGLDCCLHLLRQLCGAELANSVARHLVIAPHRQGGQAQFIDRPLPVSSSDGRFAQVLDWVAHNLAQEHSLDALAERAAMSRRNFTRHFRLATGTSFKQWLLNQRLAHAQQMLERSTASIEVVAQEAGFGSALSLRQHFKATLRISPSAYRKQFSNGA